MTPELQRAWKRVNELALKWHEPSVAVSATVCAFEETEHMRPVVDLAKALVDAKSGEARAKAIEALFAAVDRLRKAGR